MKTGGRPWRRASRLLVGLVAIIGVLALGTQSAFAESGRKSLQGQTGCLPQLASNDGWLSFSGDGYAGVDLGRATLGQASAQVDAHTCDREDRSLYVSRLTVKITYTVETVGVDSCEAGLPSGVSCSVSGNRQTYTVSRTCSNAYSCKVGFGTINVYPRSGNAVVSVGMQVTGIGQQRGKPSGSGSTSRALWKP